MKESRGWRRGVLLLGLCCVAGAASAQAKEIRVKANAPAAPPPDGMTWATAYPTVMAATAAGDTGDEVWIAEGTYAGRVRLQPGMALFGGFAGTETIREQRNSRLHRTTLVGVGDGLPVAADVTALGMESEARLDGLTLRNPRGGAVAVIGSRARIVDCDVRDCTTYPTIGCYESSLIVDRCRFTSNSVPSLQVIDVSQARIEILESTFVDSTVQTLLALTGSTGQVTRCVFRHNTGNGISCQSSTAEIVQNRFLGNRCPSGTGRIISGNGNSVGLIANNLLAGNVRDDTLDRPAVEPSGGVPPFAVIAPGPLRVLNNTIIRNHAFGGFGVALLIVGTSTEVRNNVIAFNDGGLQRSPSASVTGVSDNLFFNGARNWPESAAAGLGTVNRVADPQLWETEAWLDPRLRPTSPCRNAGMADGDAGGDVDLDGRPRVAEGRPDLGAFEFTPGETAPQVPDRLHVSPDGLDSNSGLDWAHSLRTINGAAARASEALDSQAAMAVDVWVKEGSYVERVRLPLGVRVFGSFGGSEATPAERDFALHRSVIERAVPGVGGAAAPAGPPKPAAGFGNHGIVHASMTGPWMRFDGFQVRGGLDGDGAGIYLFAASGVVANNQLEGNSSTGFGGGLFSTGGAPRIENNVFLGNSASDGGALCVFDHTPFPAWILGNVISNNAASPGAGMKLVTPVRLGSRFVFANNLLRDNEGVTAIVGVQDATDSLVVNNTFVGNRGASAPPSILSQGTNLTIANNLVFSNAGGIAVFAFPAVTVRSNCVFQSGAQGFDPPQLASENLEVDPLLMPIDSLVHLPAASPCVDAGDAAFGLPGTTDIDGEPRWMGVRPDIGADELLPSALAKFALAPVTLQTAGGITYAVWDFNCLSCEKIESAAGVEGPRVTLDLTSQSTLGPGEGCPAVCVPFRGATPLGALAAGDYRIEVTTGGQPVKTLADSVRVNDESTLELSATDAGLRLRVNGLPWAKYVVESGQDWEGWTPISSSDGAPFELPVSNDGSGLRRFRARILPP